MAVKKIKETKNAQTITKSEAVSLFTMIRDIKNGNLSREALVRYVMLRVKLKAVFDEFEKVRQEISEQTKPEDWKEGDSAEKWDEAFRPVMGEWFKERVDFETKVLTEDDCVDLIMSNPDKAGTFSDAIIEYLKK